MSRRTFGIIWLLMAVCLLATQQQVTAYEDGLPAIPADANFSRTWTIMGDSWGTLLLTPTKNELQQRGLDDDYLVLQTSIPGSTAALWADNTGGILDIIKQVIAISPPQPVLYISLGGNDLLTGYASQGEAIYDQIDADLRTIVTEVVSVRSDVRIIFAAYDILKMDKSLFCLVSAQTFLGSFLPWDVNPLFFRLGQIQASIAAEYPQVVYANVWGALQGNPGAPNPFIWSPGQYFPDDELDCVHLNDPGYAVFIDAVLDKLLGPG